MILLADAHRHANQAEASTALIHHAASVVEVFPIDVSVDNGLWGPTVSSFGRMGKESIKEKLLESVLELWWGGRERTKYSAILHFPTSPGEWWSRNDFRNHRCYRKGVAGQMTSLSELFLCFYTGGDNTPPSLWGGYGLSKSPKASCVRSSAPSL